MYHEFVSRPRAGHPKIPHNDMLITLNEKLIDGIPSKKGMWTLPCLLESEK